MERLKELIDRMVAPGPAFAHLSASEGHEIRQGCLDLIKQIETLNAEAEYLTECPSCGEGPSETGFPRMDEDGCCACCGADCSILGTVEALKEREGWDTALEFYANSTNYDEFGVPRIPHEGHPGCKVPDMGRTAKLALGRA